MSNIYINIHRFCLRIKSHRLEHLRSSLFFSNSTKSLTLVFRTISDPGATLNMYTAFKSVHALFAIILTLTHAARQPGPPNHEYSTEFHPFKTLPMFKSFAEVTSPVVLRKYYLDRNVIGNHSATGAIFNPSVASYKFRDSNLPFVKNADAFSMYKLPVVPTSDPLQFGRVFLNHPARVFAIMTSRINFYYRDPPVGFNPKLTGLPSGWTTVGVVKSLSGQKIFIGDPQRSLIALPHTALLVEVPLQTDENGNIMFNFPNMRDIFMDGDEVRSLSFLFVSPDKRKSEIGSQDLTFSEKYVNLSTFPYPGVPDPFPSLNSDSDETGLIVKPEESRPVPTRTCPKWLHDLYVTENRWPAHATPDEPRYWRTWHPTIDPFYWCYYEHEHGSWPGPHYSPMFGYVAWKTQDLNSQSGRQIESHNGFKTYYIPIHGSIRVAIFTVHMHLSKSRRFSARHHTIALAILRGSELEMDISFKSDFGPALGIPWSGLPPPLDATQKEIQEELKKLKRFAARTFNVINIDENFPESLDKRFRIKADLSKAPPAKLKGFYEEWRSTLPSCTSPITAHSGEFLFDIRDPSTAARFATGTTDGNIQWLRGASIERTIRINGPDIVLSLGSCSKMIQEKHGSSSSGVFFTDPYFRSGHPNAGQWAVRQFIKKSFEDFTFSRGFRRASDPWTGWYGINGSPGLQFIEKTTKGELN